MKLRSPGAISGAFFSRLLYNRGVRIHLSTTPQRAEAGDPWATGFLQPICTIRCEARTRRTSAHVGASLLRQWDDPLEALAWMSKTYWPGGGRWIGFLNYDLGRLFEDLPTKRPDDLDVPLFVFTYCRKAHSRPPMMEPEYRGSDEGLRSNFTRDEYVAAVRRAIDYIAAGDVFQVNLSQQFTCGVRIKPSEIYRRLVRQTPARYGAYLGYDDFAVISNSPELFLSVTADRRVITRPIKGTRANLPGMESELRQSAKDQAELNMIVDLERNDLGRVCKIGTVKVIEPRSIEAHPTVLHGVATIEGMLRDDATFVDLLRATFPGGSVTGAPKIRAMQIIDDLETVRRGAYCGAVGYLDADGTMQFNVAIRTMVIKNGLAHIPVGGGIVADSDPDLEYEETLVKAKAMFAAVGIEAGELVK
jgi:para-aminobenzoate synthetase component I